jgi:hypothetical protein
MFFVELGNMEKEDRVSFSELGFSTNMTISSLNKKEKLVAQILATQFHIKPVGEPGEDKEVILNTIMKDVIINGYIDEHHT